MPERVSIVQGVQLGIEGTSGTSVPANKLLQSLAFDPGIEINMTPFTPIGSRFPTLIVPGMEWTTFAVTGQLTYSEVIFLLSSIFGGVTNGTVGTGGKTWTYSPAQSALTTPKTFTIEHGDAVRAHEYAFATITEFGFKLDKQSCLLTAAGIATKIADGITMTATPTAQELVPVAPGQIDIYLDTSWAGLGGTKLTRVLGVEWKFSNAFGPLFVLNSANSNTFVAAVDLEPKLEVKLTVEADATGMGILTNMRAGSSVFLRIIGTGANIGVGADYTFRVDTALKVAKSPGKWKDLDGVMTLDWDLTGVYDATGTLATRLYVVNQMTNATSGL